MAANNERDPELELLGYDMLEAQRLADVAYDQYFEDCRFTGVPVFSPDTSLAFIIYRAAIEQENEARATFNAYAAEHFPAAMISPTHP